MFSTIKKNNITAKPFDIKKTILQRDYRLGDAQVAYQILDGLSFKRLFKFGSRGNYPRPLTRRKLTVSLNRVKGWLSVFNSGTNNL